jgi:hypothetical protein
MTGSRIERLSEQASIFAKLERLSAAEDFFAVLDAPYDEARLDVAPLHILERMGEYLRGDDLAGLPAAAARARTRRQSTATMTSDALMTALAGLPTASPKDSTASLVMEAVITAPEAISIFTWAVVAPRVIAITLPGRMLRAESFIERRLSHSERSRGASALPLFLREDPAPRPRSSGRRSHARLRLASCAASLAAAPAGALSGLRQRRGHERRYRSASTRRHRLRRWGRRRRVDVVLRASPRWRSAREPPR